MTRYVDFAPAHPPRPPSGAQPQARQPDSMRAMSRIPANLRRGAAIGMSLVSET